jgi:nitrous oxidase accessory protein
MKKFTYIVFFCFIFVLIYLIFFISSTTADTITVGPEGSPTYDYAAINTAISNANESDTIYVYPGTYTENIVINKKINLIGISGSDSTTIVTSSATKNTIEVTNNYVNISGFTIKNLGGSFACIKLHYATNCKINNIIIQNGGNGLFLVYSDNNIIRTCTIKSNNVGIYLSYSSNNMIYSNNIQYNNANGIFVSAGCLGNTFYLNDFLDNSDGNARDSGSNNWDYNQEGNYWDDYNDYDNNSDGIGDNSYSISGSGGNKDNYPLGDFLNTNNKPIAYIDSISPNPAIKGNVVSFTGHGTDDDTITNWEWKSSIDGILSFSKNYKTSSLSTGAHIISYRVQDNDGYWSNYVYESLVITAGNQKPYAYILEPITSITKEYGENITFLGDIIYLLHNILSILK